MKEFIISLVIIILIIGGCAVKKPSASVSVSDKQPTADTVNFSDQITWLLGYFNPVQLSREPYSSWYVKGFDGYRIDSDALNKLFDINKDSLSIKIVMGTWCPDSRREVPRFMRIIDLWKFPTEKITFIGVDNEKQSPVGEYVNLDIQRVPTFIIFKNNIEAGRIIENPVTSLEQDMVNILTRNE
jgi:thiol-disulfide isomerase/thioredoxin